MQHQEVDPPEALRDTIKCFWHTRRDGGELPASFAVVPDGYVELNFLLWQPLPPRHSGRLAVPTFPVSAGAAPAAGHFSSGLAHELGRGRHRSGWPGSASR